MQTPLPPHADVRHCEETHASHQTAEINKYRIEELRTIITERSLFLSHCSALLREEAENRLTSAEDELHRLLSAEDKADIDLEESIPTESFGWVRGAMRTIFRLPFMRKHSDAESPPVSEERLAV